MVAIGLNIHVFFIIIIGSTFILMRESCITPNLLRNFVIFKFLFHWLTFLHQICSCQIVLDLLLASRLSWVFWSLCDIRLLPGVERLLNGFLSFLLLVFFILHLILYSTF